MKHILFVFTLLLLFSCKAQITTVGIYEAEDGEENNHYYKDLNNDFNPFIGSWIYTQGTDSLVLNLNKKIMRQIQDNTSNYYLDALVGEVKYVENGIEKLDYLSNLNNDFINPFDYNIFIDFITKYGDGGCGDCGPNDIKVSGTYDEPNCYTPGLNTDIFLRYYVEAGIEKLELKLRSSGMPNYSSGDVVCQGNALPYGRYTLVKQ